MQVSQKTIANALNVSIVTVSRALRNRPDLAEDTKHRILQKAQELGYKKNSAKAAAAKPGKDTQVRRVGILFYENEGTPHIDMLKSEALRLIFRSIQKECQRLEVETLIETPSTDHSVTPLILKNRAVDGVFLLGRYSAKTVEMIGDTPVLAVSSFIECPKLPRIVADNFHGMRKATDHLIQLGHKKILFIGDIQQGTQLFRERSYGYMAAMHEQGLAPSVHFFESSNKPVPLEEISRHTAVACSNDTIAYLIQRKLLAVGKKLPEDCSLVSFDNLAPLDHPNPITSYGPDWELMGKMAADLLLSTPLDIRGKNVVVTIPGTLFVHKSTCPIAG
ncbi:MAG: LacI family DNA-binding transcriptional regulator [Rariglobus sp.]|nr:LacI family DNA-binding transcriptional regulator [Rariglobus sp.]